MTPADVRDDSAPVLSMRSAFFGYAGKAVVSDVTLEVAPGEVVALLGANGSGKTTVVRGLLGLNDHLGGDLELFGVPRSRFHQHSRLGYVPQRHTLSASVRATVTEIVAIGRLPHQSWWARPTRQDRQIIAESLELVGLGDRAQEDVNTLSGGQQRRVLIARALAAQPDVLVLDEPTAGVDLGSQQVLTDVLRRLAARGTTMLVVTHEPDALHTIVSRVVAMSGGRVVFDGRPEAYARQRAATGLFPADIHHHHDEADLPRHRPAGPGAGPLDGGRGGRHA